MAPDWTPRLRAFAPHVRRLASKGWTAGAAARALGITPAEARWILGRPAAPRAPRPPRAPHRRPPARRSAWHPSNGPEYRPDDSPLPAAPAAAAVAGPPAPMPLPAPAGEWGTLRVPRAGALDADQVERLRRGRAAGRSLKELAELVDASVATVKRALCPVYRAAPSPAPVPAMPPPIAAAEGPGPVRWEEAGDRRRR